jgi:hypothetical protein
VTPQRWCRRMTRSSVCHDQQTDWLQ